MNQTLFSGLIGLIALCCATTSFGQASVPFDPYAKARGIVEVLEKIVAPNGVQESYQTAIGGVKQWVFGWGQDRRNPIILFVHGGPASPMFLGCFWSTSGLQNEQNS